MHVRDAQDANAAGNRFVPARFPVPIDIVDPIARMQAIRRLVGRQRAEPAMGLLDDVSRIVRRLPKPMYTALRRLPRARIGGGAGRLAARLAGEA